MGKLSEKLTSARKSKNDEFYTQMPDIELECNHYKKDFYNKVIYCNCDNPYESNFYKYFVSHFNEFNIKKVIATCYIENSNGICAIYDGVETIYNLNGDGDFRSDECIKFIEECDILVTNPPFSLFRDYINLVMKYNKKFIVIGNMNAIKYKEIFPHIIENKMWIGYGFNMSMIFKTLYPNLLDANRKYVKSKGYDPDDNFVKTPSIAWYTNIEIDRRKEKLVLTETYSPDKYDKFSNYDAINVNKVSDIPCDYNEIIGVPITFLNKHNPEQFKLIGVANHGKDNKYDLFAPIVNGIDIYTRILIKKL
jgi:hypothetical protein